MPDNRIFIGIMVHCRVALKITYSHLGYSVEEETKALVYFKETTINNLHAADSFLRTQYFLSHSINSSHLTEPESSSLCSQKPTNCPSPKPDESNPCTLIMFLWDPFEYYPPTST